MSQPPATNTSVTESKGTDSAFRSTTGSSRRSSFRSDRTTPGRRRVTFDGEVDETQRRRSDTGATPGLDTSQLQPVSCNFGLLAVGGVYETEALRLGTGCPLGSTQTDGPVEVVTTRGQDGTVKVLARVTASRAGDISSLFHVPLAEGKQALTLRVNGTVMDRGKGTPQLQSHVHRVGTYITDSTDDELDSGI